MAELVGTLSCKPKVYGFNPWTRCTQEVTSQYFSLTSMVLPPFLSLLKNKAKQDKKNMEKMPLGEDFLKTTLGVDCY